MFLPWLLIIDGNTKYLGFDLEERDPLRPEWLELPDFWDVVRYPTYEEVAEAYEMPEEMKTRYVEYMRTRWAEAEAMECAVGYAQEWAGRFINGVEFGSSDTISRSILKGLMDKRGQQAEKIKNDYLLALVDKAEMDGALKYRNSPQFGIDAEMLMREMGWTEPA